jgi:hypothetical protein
VDLRTGLEDVERRTFLTLPELELRLFGRPARSQSLYRLRYPGSSCDLYKFIIAGFPTLVVAVSSMSRSGAGRICR